MNTKSLFLAAALLAASLSSFAQDLKPSKDKETKLYGYIDSKTKEWVIPAQYDDADRFNKLGLAKVMIKDTTGLKNYGVIGFDGKEIIPIECRAIEFNKSDALIYARKDVFMDRFGNMPMWGVYNAEGSEYIAPSLRYAPNFNKGRSIVTDARTNYEGVIDLSGAEVIPVRNLSVEKHGNQYVALTPDFVRAEYDINGVLLAGFEYPGYIAPYDPMGDDVRTAAFGSRHIGERLYLNQIRFAEIGMGRGGRSARCSLLPLQWDPLRFVRLEPEVDTVGHSFSMMYKGVPYTIAAQMYDQNGNYLETVSDWGYYEATFNGGVVYVARGEERWVVFDDINATSAPVYSLTLKNYRVINTETVQNALDISNSTLRRLDDLYTLNDRKRDILLSENAGISYHMDRPEQHVEALKTIDRSVRSPLLTKAYHMGEVRNCKVKTNASKPGEVTVNMAPSLVLHFEDEFEDSDIRMRTDQEIFWGPHNARTIRLSLEAKPYDPAKGAEKCPMIFDDKYGTRFMYYIVVSLYEEDGRFIQTLGESAGLVYATSEAVVLKDLGIALVHDDRERIELSEVVPFKNTISALEVLGMPEIPFRTTAH